MQSSFWADFLLSLEKKQKSIPILFSLLRQLQPVFVSEDKIILGCSNQGQKFFFEKKAFELEAEIEEFFGKKIAVSFAVQEQKKRARAPAPLLEFQPSINDVFQKAGLLPKYSFDNFAVSSTNQVAYAAALAVSKSLGHSYNPLFLYGGVGVGKTHLAQSVAKKILVAAPDLRVFFCPGDQFTNELIESIREKSTMRFRRKYRNLNLFIIDDIQFIAGKNAVQEEFFHTFNAIVSAGGQVIMTSDKAPHEIDGLEDRLRSRFSGGLSVDVQAPDFELRCAIVLIKAKEKNIDVDIEAAKVIASFVTDSRALEGALLSLYTKTLNTKERIDKRLAEEHFQQQQKSLVVKIVPNDIIKTVCSYFNIRPAHLRGQERISSIVLPRQLAMYILRNHLGLKLNEVAGLLHRKDHTTVLHAVNKINRRLTKDPLFKKEVDQLLQTMKLST